MNPRWLAFGICLALGMVRCGGSSPSSSSVGSGADAGSGGGGGGGGADAGSGGGTDGGGGGTDGGGGADGGSGGGDADGGGGGTDGGGTDGGTASNECDGLGADPNASSITITAPSDQCGLSATSDSSGNIALSGTADATTSKEWATYDRGGARLGTLHAYGPVIPRGSGFFGIDRLKNSTNPPQDYLHVWTFAPDGSGPSQNVGGYLCLASLERTAAGGVLMNERCGSGPTVGSRIVWYDDAGTQKWSTPINRPDPSANVPPPQPNAAAGDVGGNVLITAPSESVGGRPAGDLFAHWIAPDGSMLGDWFLLVAGNSMAPVLHPLIGGGVAVSQSGAWKAVVMPGAGPKPAPDWLTSRYDQDFRIVRGRKAYAFTRKIEMTPHGSFGGPAVEVVAPSGASCGTFDTKGYGSTVGGDGTVIANTDECTRRVWPGLLGGH